MTNIETFNITLNEHTFEQIFEIEEELGRYNLMIINLNARILFKKRSFLKI